MNIAFIEAAAKALKNISDLAVKTMDFSDPKKHVENIDNLSKGVSESFTLMRNIVNEDDTLTANEKLDRLKEIANEETAVIEKCGKVLDEHQEKTMRIVKDVVTGFFTAGLSFTPNIIEIVKLAVKEKEQLPESFVDDCIFEADEITETDEQEQ